MKHFNTEDLLSRVQQLDAGAEMTEEQLWQLWDDVKMLGNTKDEISSRLKGTLVKRLQRPLYQFFGAGQRTNDDRRLRIKPKTKTEHRHDSAQPQLEIVLSCLGLDIDMAPKLAPLLAKNWFLKSVLESYFGEEVVDDLLKTVKVMDITEDSPTLKEASEPPREPVLEVVEETYGFSGDYTREQFRKALEGEDS